MEVDLGRPGAYGRATMTMFTTIRATRFPRYWYGWYIPAA